MPLRNAISGVSMTQAPARYSS